MCVCVKLIAIKDFKMLVESKASYPGSAPQSIASYIRYSIYKLIIQYTLLCYFT